MKLQVIEIKSNDLVFELAEANKVPFLPSIGEMISLESGPWLVKGIAHMWDRQLVKILVVSASN